MEVRFQWTLFFSLIIFRKSKLSSGNCPCKKVGVNFSLYDFGTGYPSLAHLKNLPSDSLNIDQSFLQDMLTNSDDLAIVQRIISLAEVFGRNVIAECVESAAHGAKLVSIN